MKHTILSGGLATLLAISLLPASALAHGPKGYGFAAPKQVVTTTTTTTTTHTVHPSYLALHRSHSRGMPRQSRHPSRHHHPHHVVVLPQAAPQRDATLRIRIGYDLQL